MADVTIPTSIPSTLAQWIYIDTEHCKTICTRPKCMRAIPTDRIASHCSTKHKKWPSKHLRAFKEFLEQLGWENRDNAVVQDGLAPHPHLPVTDGFQCQHCPIRFQVSDFEAAQQHRLRHGSIVVCMERFMVRMQSWSGEGPYWLVSEGESGPVSGDLRQTLAEQGKFMVEEQMEEQANRKIEELSVDQAGIVDNIFDVGSDGWVLVELPGQKK